MTALITIVDASLSEVGHWSEVLVELSPPASTAHPAAAVPAVVSTAAAAMGTAHRWRLRRPDRRSSSVGLDARFFPVANHEFTQHRTGPVEPGPNSPRRDVESFRYLGVAQFFPGVQQDDLPTLIELSTPTVSFDVTAQAGGQ